MRVYDQNAVRKQMPAAARVVYPEKSTVHMVPTMSPRKAQRLVDSVKRKVSVENQAQASVQVLPVKESGESPNEERQESRNDDCDRSDCNNKTSSSGTSGGKRPLENLASPRSPQESIKVVSLQDRRKRAMARVRCHAINTGSQKTSLSTACITNERDQPAEPEAFVDIPKDLGMYTEPGSKNKKWPDDGKFRSTIHLATSPSRQRALTEKRARLAKAAKKQQERLAEGAGPAKEHQKSPPPPAEISRDQWAPTNMQTGHQLPLGNLAPSSIHKRTWKPQQSSPQSHRSPTTTLTPSSCHQISKRWTIQSRSTSPRSTPSVGTNKTLSPQTRPHQSPNLSESCRAPVLPAKTAHDDHNCGASSFRPSPTKTRPDNRYEVVSPILETADTCQIFSQPIVPQDEHKRFASISDTVERVMATVPLKRWAPTPKIDSRNLYFMSSSSSPATSSQQWMKPKEKNTDGLMASSEVSSATSKPDRTSSPKTSKAASTEGSNEASHEPDISPFHHGQKTFYSPPMPIRTSDRYLAESSKVKRSYINNTTGEPARAKAQFFRRDEIKDMLSPPAHSTCLTRKPSSQAELTGKHDSRLDSIDQSITDTTQTPISGQNIERPDKVSVSSMKARFSSTHISHKTKSGKVCKTKMEDEVKVFEKSPTSPSIKPVQVRRVRETSVKVNVASIAERFAIATITRQSQSPTPNSKARIGLKAESFVSVKARLPESKPRAPASPKPAPSPLTIVSNTSLCLTSPSNGRDSTSPIEKSKEREKRPEKASSEGETGFRQYLQRLASKKSPSFSQMASPAPNAPRSPSQIERFRQKGFFGSPCVRHSTACEVTGGEKGKLSSPLKPHAESGLLFTTVTMQEKIPEDKLTPVFEPMSNNDLESQLRELSYHDQLEGKIRHSTTQTTVSMIEKQEKAEDRNVETAQRDSEALKTSINSHEATLHSPREASSRSFLAVATASSPHPLRTSNRNSQSPSFRNRDHPWKKDVIALSPVGWRRQVEAMLHCCDESPGRLQKRDADRLSCEKIEAKAKPIGQAVEKTDEKCKLVDKVAQSLVPFHDLVTDPKPAIDNLAPTPSGGLPTLATDGDSGIVACSSEDSILDNGTPALSPKESLLDDSTVSAAETLLDGDPVSSKDSLLDGASTESFVRKSSLTRLTNFLKDQPQTKPLDDAFAVLKPKSEYNERPRAGASAVLKFWSSTSTEEEEETKSGIGKDGDAESVGPFSVNPPIKSLSVRESPLRNETKPPELDPFSIDAVAALEVSRAQHYDREPSTFDPFWEETTSEPAVDFGGGNNFFSSTPDPFADFDVPSKRSSLPVRESFSPPIFTVVASHGDPNNCQPGGQTEKFSRLAPPSGSMDSASDIEPHVWSFEVDDPFAMDHQAKPVSTPKF
jgi:hypothetical protein